MGGVIPPAGLRSSGRSLGRRVATIGAATSLLAGAPAAAGAAELVDFGDCGQLVRFVRAGAESDAVTYPAGWINGSWDASLPTRAAWPKERFKDSPYDDDSMIVQDDLDSGADAESADDVSGTNTQEAEVDEPDLVKADRRYLYVMAGSRLRIYRHRPSVPVLVAQLRLPIAEGRLLRSGDRLLVIGARPRRELEPALEPLPGTPDPASTAAPQPTTPGTTPTTPDATKPTTPPATSPSTAAAAARATATTPGTTPTTPSGTTPEATTPTTPGTTPTTPTATTPVDPWPVPATDEWDMPSARYPFTTRLLEVNIEEPDAPELQRTLDAPGTPITARQVGSTVRLVIDASTDPDDEEDEDVTLDELRPFTRLESEVTGDVYRRPAAPCTDIARPSGGYSGADLLSVLTFDLDRGLVAPQRLGVMARPQTVYASASTLYVASSVETERETADGYAGDSATDIFAFDATEAGRTTYLAHGSVPGLPINHYAFSERGGDLRVATSTYAWWERYEEYSDEYSDEDEEAEEASAERHSDVEIVEDDSLDGDEEDDEQSDWGEDADTRLTVLRRDGEQLREIGVRSGLDKGEQVSAVRYDGDRAYVASSGADDPLRILDLSDPAAPHALGVLRLPGASTYLHPLGDGLLLSIGRDRVRGDDDVWGSRVSLYDVADPEHPVRLAARRLGPGWTPTDYDSHAFLWWPRRQLAFVPYAGSTWDEDEDDPAPPSSMVVLRAAREEGTPNLVERGRVTHGPDWDHVPVIRAVVVGDKVLTISQLGISSNRLSDLERLGTLPFHPLR